MKRTKLTATCRWKIGGFHHQNFFFSPYVYENLLKTIKIFQINLQKLFPQESFNNETGIVNNAHITHLLHFTPDSVPT